MERQLRMKRNTMVVAGARQGQFILFVRVIIPPRPVKTSTRRTGAGSSGLDLGKNSVSETSPTRPAQQGADTPSIRS